MKLPDHLRTGEVAALFGVHHTTVRRWAAEGLLTPGRTPGGRRRFAREQVLALLNQHAAATPVEQAEVK